MKVLVIVLTVLGTFAGFGLPAEAAQPPRVHAYACGPLVASRGPSRVWQTWFTGVKRDLWDNHRRYTAAPCFASLSACKAWLYWAQSDWPDRNTFRPCRRGLHY